MSEEKKETPKEVKESKDWSNVIIIVSGIILGAIGVLVYLYG